MKALAVSPENPWRSLFRVCAVLLPLAGVFVVAYAVLYYVYEFAGFCPQGSCAFVSVLEYIGNNALLFNSAEVLVVLAVLAFLPAVLALYVALRRTDVGFSLIGTVFTVAGIGIILSNASQLFFEVQEAQVWDGGCTVCGNTPIEGAAGTGSMYVAGELGSLLILVGVIILSVVMLRGSSFSKVSGYLGLLAGLVGIIGTFAFGSLSGVAYDATSVLPYVLLALWAFSISPRMFRL
jgi:hypothetical protein